MLLVFGGAIPGESLGPVAPGAAQALAQRGIVEQAFNGSGEGVGIFRGDEEAGFIRANCVCQPGDVCADDGFGRGACFNGDDAPAFVARGDAHKKGIADEVVFLFGGDRPGQFEAVCDVECIGHRSQFALALGRSLAREDEANVSTGFGKGGQEYVDAFVVNVQATKIQDVIAFSPGRVKAELIHAGVHEVKLRVVFIRRQAFLKLMFCRGRDGQNVRVKAKGAAFGFAGDVTEQGIFFNGVVAHEMAKFEEAIAPPFGGYAERGKGRELMHPEVRADAGDFSGRQASEAHATQEIRAARSQAADVYAISDFFFGRVGIRAGQNGDLVVVREAPGYFPGANRTPAPAPRVVGVVVYGV